MHAYQLTTQTGAENVELAVKQIAEIIGAYAIWSFQCTHVCLLLECNEVPCILVS